MEYTYCYNNCIYRCVSPEAIPVFKLEEVTAKISMRFYQTKEWEECRVEEKYIQYVDYKVSRVIKTFNV